MNHAKELADACEAFAKWFDGWCPNQTCCARTGLPVHEQALTALSRYRAAVADDAELVTGEWLKRVVPLGESRLDFNLYPDFIGYCIFDGDVTEYIPFGIQPKTRSQFRSLCQALGITLEEGQ
jgi:hypothetical protein